jgi:hypothetical protein
MIKNNHLDINKRRRKEGKGHSLTYGCPGIEFIIVL